MTRANPGARIKDPRTDWEWRALRLGEDSRTCVDCGREYIPTGRVQKYCTRCQPKHRGKRVYGGEAGYKAFRAARDAKTGESAHEVENGAHVAPKSA